MGWLVIPGCYLCGLSVVEAIALGTMMAAGETTAENASPSRRPLLVCPDHREQLAHLDAQKLARIAEWVTGRAFRVVGRPQLGGG
jgi:hypothetical protein